MNDYYAITNYNFDYIEGTTYLYDKIGHEYKFEKNENGDIVFETNFLACPCIYWIKKDDLFCFCFEAGQVVYFANENNIALESFDKTTLGEIGNHLKKSISDNYQHKLEYIENWKKVILHKDGTFEKIDYPLMPYSLELKDNYNLFINWLRKYKNIISELIIENKFIPTLTGGLDSRTFVALYKDKLSTYNLNYHLKSVKPDGKNSVEKGGAEICFADIIAKKVGLKERQENIDEGKTSISAVLNENARFLQNPNNVDFVYKYIQHSYNNSIKYDKTLLPFIDDDYLKLKQEKNFMRVLLALLLIPDLLDVNLIGTVKDFEENSNGYLFEEKYADIIPQAQELITYWESKYGKFVL